MKKMKHAFTLVELMAVVTIMTLLGFAAVGGYSAMQRGMRERGAVAAASAILRAAKERAAVDRVPTAVYCYNVMLRASDADADENAKIVGVMTAVRRAGRLTMVENELLYDEFADLNTTYPCMSDIADLSFDRQKHKEADLMKCSTMKLYRFPMTASDTYSTSGTMEYSLVSDTVWCTEKNKIFLFSEMPPAYSDGTNCFMSAFYERSGSRYPLSGGWHVGDAYAFSIGELQLPVNMTFGKDMPSSVSKISKPTVIVFDPERRDDGTVDIYTVLPGTGGSQRFQKAGTATSDEKKKQ